jgi:hypothetical protein
MMSASDDRAPTLRQLVPWRFVRSYIGAALRGLFREELARSRTETTAELEKSLSQLNSSLLQLEGNLSKIKNSLLQLEGNLSQIKRDSNTQLSQINQNYLRVFDSQHQLKDSLYDFQRDLLTRIEFYLNDLSQPIINRQEIPSEEAVALAREAIDNRLGQ